MDIFQGVAENYTKYRGEYPKEMIELIISKLDLDNSSRLLDVGCGDGRLTFSLAPYFKEVLAIDISSEMIAKAKGNTKLNGINNITWLIKDAGNLDESVGKFSFIVFGQSLHWLNIEKILSFCHSILEPGGAVMVSQVPSIWNYAPTKWEQKIIEIIKKYLGPKRRTINGFFERPKKSYEDYLKEAGFVRLEEIEFIFPKTTKTADKIVEEQFTYSYATRILFGDRAKDFENELREELLKINPENKFISETKGIITLAFKD